MGYVEEQSVVDPEEGKTEIMRAYKDGTILRSYDQQLDEVKSMMLPSGG